MTCLSATCEPRTIDQPFDYWRTHHVYYVASQPRTSDRLISHWNALCLLAHDNRRCSITVYSLRFSLIKILPEPGFDLGSTAGESSVLKTARLHMLYIYFITDLSRIKFYHLFYHCFINLLIIRNA